MVYCYCCPCMRGSCIYMSVLSVYEELQMFAVLTFLIDNNCSTFDIMIGITS